MRKALAGGVLACLVVLSTGGSFVAAAISGLIVVAATPVLVRILPDPTSNRF
ncbi:MAG: hypothetical protein M1600_16775 [Firmicutes bacterium]|nr:hypothetical protein [Bacillota bacterium]